MKQLILLCLALQSIQAEKLGNIEHQSLHIYNHKSSIQNKLDRKMHRLHKIDEDKAMQIAKKHCKDEKIRIKLVHKKAYLLYDINSRSCSFYIDALDGKVIDKKLFWGDNK